MTPWLVLPLALQVLSALATPVPGNNNGHERCGNSQPTLRSAASGDGKLYFGSAVASYYFANTNFSAITKTQIGQFTPENEMKWEVIHPEPNSYNWTGSDLVCAVHWKLLTIRSLPKRASRVLSSADTIFVGIARRGFGVWRHC